MILAPLQKLPKNVEDLGKLIVAKGFKKLSKVQKIANSGHTAPHLPTQTGLNNSLQDESINLFPSSLLRLHLSNFPISTY